MTLMQILTHLKCKVRKATYNLEAFAEPSSRILCTTSETVVLRGFRKISGLRHGGTFLCEFGKRHVIKRNPNTTWNRNDIF